MRRGTLLLIRLRKTRHIKSTNLVFKVKPRATRSTTMTKVCTATFLNVALVQIVSLVVSRFGTKRTLAYNDMGGRRPGRLVAANTMRRAIVENGTSRNLHRLIVPRNENVASALARGCTPRMKRWWWWCGHRGVPSDACTIWKRRGWMIELASLMGNATGSSQWRRFQFFVLWSSCWDRRSSRRRGRIREGAPVRGAPSSWYPETSQHDVHAFLATRLNNPSTQRRMICDFFLFSLRPCYWSSMNTLKPLQGTMVMRQCLNE